MNRIYSKLFSVLAVLLCAAILVAADQTQPLPDLSGPETPLSPEYKKWVDLDVSAIISDYERNAFLGLKTDTARDKFIQEFWLDRDPTPGTKQNEYKDEYEARMKYVNENFNRESSLPACKTERGKVWLLMGKPQFRKRFPEDNTMVPIELWQYASVKDYGLPSSFYVLFYQKNGFGPYRMYSPASDGPEALIKNAAGLDPSTKTSGDARKQKQDTFTSNVYYETLNTIDPELAFASFSLLPSEGSYAGGITGTAEITSEVILGKVENARNFQFDKREYVDRLLTGRPKVDVYYSLGPQDVKNDIFWFQAPTGEFLLDYAVQFAADKFNMGQYEDKFYTSLSVDGTIQTAKDNVTVESISSSHEINLDKEQFEKIRYEPFQYLGRRVIIPGNYKISLLIHNNLTKSMVPIVEDFQVPDFDTATKPYFSRLLFVQGSENATPNAKGLKPFQFGNVILQPLVEHRYAQGQEATFFYQLFFPEPSLPLSGTDLTLEYEVLQQGKSIGKVSNSFASKVPGDVQEGSINVFDHFELSAQALNGPAKLIARLKKGEKTLAESAPAFFDFNPTKVPTPWRLISGIPPLDSSYHKYVLAQQYIRVGEDDKAIQLLGDVTDGPAGTDAKIQLMRLQLKAKQYDKVLNLAHDLEIRYPKNKDLLWLMGWAHYGLNQYDDALRFFERGRMEEPQSVQILNVLADVYQRLSRFDKSLEMINKSLALEPGQADILQMKEAIQKEISGG